MNHPLSTKFHVSFTIMMVLALLVPLFAQAAEQTGFVKSGDTPIAFAKVTLYLAGTGRASRTMVLGSTKADESGFFHITYTPPSSDNAILYLIADGPRLESKNQKSGSIIKFRKKHFHFAPIITFESKSKSRRNPIRLATVLGSAPFPSEVVINELTTVASAYSLAQFFVRSNLKGEPPGLPNAAMMVQNFVVLETGEISPVLHDFANRKTSTLNTFNSLANMVAACVNEMDMCSTFLDLATTPRGHTPRNTLQALVNIVHNPWQNVRKLFRLSLKSSVYQPALEPLSPPDAWTLALRFLGVPNTMSGPGNLAFDATGNAWVTNNFDFEENPKNVCGSDLLLAFKPNGKPLFDPPLQGGGLTGAGFGITLDPARNIWVGNFGFAGVLCDDEVPENSLSKFSPEGIPLSGDEGFRNGPIRGPQGTVSDRQGNIWIANCGNNTIVQYPGGDNTTPKVFGPFGPKGRDLRAPFDIAINHRGWAFITGNHSNTVVVLRRDGSPIRQSPIGGKPLIDLPMGIASDSKGNMWVANSAAMHLPCPTNAQLRLDKTSRKGSITLITRNGIPAKGSPFKGGGLTIPWGITVDGNDNVWVANFFDRRISQFCGRKTKNCPPGYDTGDPISPNVTGYGFDGLERITGIQIDPSGNVWVTNNLFEDFNIANPGARTIVAFVGLAGPIKTPLIGPPQRP